MDPIPARIRIRVIPIPALLDVIPAPDPDPLKSGIVTPLVLPGPAWVLLSKKYILFPGALYYQSSLIMFDTPSFTFCQLWPWNNG